MKINIPEEQLLPSKVITAALSSVKRRAFSRKQTMGQKFVSFSIALLVLLTSLEFIGFAGLIPAIITFLIIRWKNLGVLHLRENMLFSIMLVYATLLSIVSFFYGVLYTRIFRFIKSVQFFPRFPYNEQTVTKSATKGEILKRDGFWKDKLPKKVPSPNFLTIARIIGAISLLFLGSITSPIYFFIGASILFLTDYYDGIIARTRNRETLFGKWADPIADWLLLFSVFLYIYRINPSFGIMYIHMALPQIFIVLFFGILFLLSGKIDTPRPVIWGRLKFTLYALGAISMLLGKTEIAQICFSFGIVFAYTALGSYVTRKYQETKKESIFNGILRLCFYSWRIRYELAEKN